MKTFCFLAISWLALTYSGVTLGDAPVALNPGAVAPAYVDGACFGQPMLARVSVLTEPVNSWRASDTPLAHTVLSVVNIPAASRPLRKSQILE